VSIQEEMRHDAMTGMTEREDCNFTGFGIQ